MENKTYMIYKITVEGTTPYMQHRMDDIKLALQEKKRGHIIERPDISLEDNIIADFHSYHVNGSYFIPSEHFRIAFIQGGGFLKSKVGARTKSMKSIIAAILMINPENIPIQPYDQIDKRSAVNKNIKARIIVIRPKWSKWEVGFNMLFDNDTITKETIMQLVNDTGSYVGIGSYRPTNNGYFGRFKLKEIEKI
jgi:hypothetical protein